MQEKDRELTRQDEISARGYENTAYLKVATVIKVITLDPDFVRRNESKITAEKKK